MRDRLSKHQFGSGRERTAWVARRQDLANLDGPRIRAGLNESRSCFPPEFFVPFVSFCSMTRPITCTRFSPKLTDSRVKLLAPPSKCTGSWGQDCWRASTSGACCASSRTLQACPARRKPALNCRLQLRRVPLWETSRDHLSGCGVMRSTTTEGILRSLLGLEIGRMRGDSGREAGGQGEDRDDGSI